MREATIWAQCHAPCRAQLNYWAQDRADSILFSPLLSGDPKDAHIVEFELSGLIPGTTYHYRIDVDGVAVPFEPALTFRTQPLWQWRTDPPDFTVAMGSCTYINEPEYDRPGRSYGDGYGIFDAIAEKGPDLMLWLGDNIYLREPDWDGRAGYLHRYTHTRSAPEMQRLLRSTRHYAIWDDHDFGPNDADGSWINSALAREMFDLFWPNPTCGVPGAEETVATAFTHGDIDFFLLDDRTHRVPGDLRTEEPAMLGRAQNDLLILALKYSRAPFKLVAVGSQVLSNAAVFENYATIPGERAELLRRIEEEGIKGVVFLTGDRHFSQLSSVKLKDGRTLLDLTVSPLTSGVYKPKETNDDLVEGTLVEQRNFATLTFHGKRDDRVMDIRVFDAGGQLLWERSIPQE